MGPASKPVVGPGNNTFILQPGKHEMKIVDTAPQLEAAFKHSLIIDISDISTIILSSPTYTPTSLYVGHSL